jgi:hypothetical protein
MDPSGQKKNRSMPKELLVALVIVRGDLEMTVKEWVKYLRNEKNHMNREYTKTVIDHYAQRKQHGFSYKVYEDWPNETWYKVMNSENKKGHWEISDQNRIARVSKYARNVIDCTRFGFGEKYPAIKINGKNRQLHDVAFEAFYPELHASKLPHEIILHRYDDKLDFRPHVLRIGTKSENAKDARINGCYDGKKTARMPCCSYINGVFEKRYESQDSAVAYLRANGKTRASASEISIALSSKKVLIRYDRTWTHS